MSESDISSQVQRELMATAPPHGGYNVERSSVRFVSV